MRLPPLPERRPAVLTCFMCGARETHTYGWKSLDLSSRSIHLCPSEIPPDEAGDKAITAAYLRVISKLQGTAKCATDPTAEPAVAPTP